MYIFKYNKFFRYLERHNISTMEFKKKTGISKFIIRKMKNGEEINAGTLYEMTIALNCSADDLFEMYNDNESEFQRIHNCRDQDK